MPEAPRRITVTLAGMQRHNVLLTALVAMVVAAGCSRSSADRTPADPEPAPTLPSAASTERAYTVTGIYLDPLLMSGCGLTEVQAFFEYDSVEVDTHTDQVLHRVAQCITTGPLKGRRVRVVGHTDPVGPDRYNDELGKSRAQAVRDYLVFHGVPAAEIEFLSMGETGADESHPAEWPYDRRVDVFLAPVSR